MSDKEFHRSETQDYIDLAMVTGRCAAQLIDQIATHLTARTANIFTIIDTLASLEERPGARPSPTKPASQFNGKWLGGLWHKHYSQPRFLACNLANHLTNKRFAAIAEETVGVDNEFDADAVARFVHAAVIGNYEQRAGAAKLTGEWIVFAKEPTGNVYLTLADHIEDDEAIWRRCAACAPEFPDLAILQEIRG
jgi:hypothetical protein